MKYALCVKLCKHDFTTAAVIGLKFSSLPAVISVYPFQENFQPPGLLKPPCLLNLKKISCILGFQEKIPSTRLFEPLLVLATLEYINRQFSGQCSESIQKLSITDRNFVAISSQQVLHFDLEVKYQGEHFSKKSFLHFSNQVCSQ